MKDYLIDNKFLYDLEYNFLIFISFLTKLFFVLFIFGFLEEKQKYFMEIAFIVKIFIGIFLIYRFNTYRKQKIIFTELDRKVCYSAGIYLILISFIDYINYYIDQIRSFINPYTAPFVKPITDNIKPITDNIKLITDYIKKLIKNDS